MGHAERLLDLFSGCGGFSLGAHLAGFDVGLAVDVDPILSSSFGTNFPNVKQARLDLSEVDPQELLSRFPDRRVAGIIGGPPCQGFSEIGRRHKGDARRDLVWHFFRIVAAVRPSFFVMENVRGLGYVGNREVLDRAVDLVASRYEIIGPITLDASTFGAPTQRKRIFVIGIDRREWDMPVIEDLISTSQAITTVKDAIHDLASARLSHVDEDERDWWTYGPRGTISTYAQDARGAPPAGLGKAAMWGRFSGHGRTRHTPSVQERFATVAQGGQDPVGKHMRLAWTGLCPTLRAGTGSDRGSYQSVRPIHPDEDRVITAREGARLQGFPDWFMFHPTIWHSFRMIGNSVSPPMSRAVLSWIRGSRLREMEIRNAAQ